MTDSVMIDIETLGQAPDAVVVSIGAVRFSLDTGSVDEAGGFYRAIDPTSDPVGKFDASTIVWWMKQSQAARDAWMTGGISAKAALSDFYFWTREIVGNVWANPPTFDLTILDSLYKRHGIQKPWHYRQERCSRTLFNLAIDRGFSPLIADKPHHALQDAILQAHGLCAAYRFLFPSRP